MNDDTIRMAREVLDRMPPNAHYREPYWTATNKELKAFAALVAAAEREACAKVADGWSKRDDDVGAFIGKAIRARGNT